MRLALLTLLVLTACSWEPIAGPHAAKPCHRVYADTIALTTATRDTTITFGACHPK